MDLHEQGMSSRTFVIAAIVCVLLQAGRRRAREGRLRH